MNYNMNSQTELTDLIVESKNREKSRECWNQVFQVLKFQDRARMASELRTASESFVCQGA